MIAAAVILVGVVLPAEYRIDPLGIGEATGLLQLAKPEQVEIALPAGDSANSLARFYPTAFRNAGSSSMNSRELSQVTNGTERRFIELDGCDAIINDQVRNRGG